VTTRTGRSPHRSQPAAGLTQIERAVATPLGDRAGLTTLEAANDLLAATWVPFHNRWTVAPAGAGTASSPLRAANSTASWPCRR